MFDHRELQTLISGAEVPVDVDDLKQHTNYSGMKCKPLGVTEEFLNHAYCFGKKKLTYCLVIIFDVKFVHKADIFLLQAVTRQIIK